MIRLVRILGVGLMVVGSLAILSWMIKPLRDVWPMIIDSFRAMPIAIQIGLILAAIGFVLLFGSIIWERLEDRKTETNLLDDE